MAVSKLSLYNNALLAIGERPLVTDTDDVETRHRLDAVYDQVAIDACLELVKPKFALKTEKLTSPSTTTEHGLQYVYAVPSTYASFHSVFSDAALDEPIHRRMLENRTISCDFDTNIWLRYVSNDRPLSNWTPLFAEVVSTYLAKQIAPRFAPQKIDTLNDSFVGLVESAVTIEGSKESNPRPRAATTTLTEDWRTVYNNALLLLGLPQITSVSADSEFRSRLDVVVSGGLVKRVLEDIGWTFGMVSTKITYDVSLEPAWGYKRVFAKPADMVRLGGIFSDEYFINALSFYEEEDSRWFADVEDIYVKYVKAQFLTNPSQWPQHFSDIVAAELAVWAGPGIKQANLKNAQEERDKLSRKGKSADAMAGPPQHIGQGSWNSARRGYGRGTGYRSDRP